MQALVQDGKYQVHKILVAQDGYEAAVCINVECQNYYEPILLNIYKDSQYIRQYLKLFYELDKTFHSDFIEIMTHPEGICVAFKYYEGIPIRSYCKQISEHELNKRIQTLEMIFEGLLVAEQLDLSLMRLVYKVDHLMMFEKENKVKVNYILEPDSAIEDDFRIKEISEVLDSLFKPDRYMPEAIKQYIEELKHNKYKNTISMYARLREIKEDVLKEYDDLKKESFLTYLKRKIKSRFKRKSPKK